MTNVLPRPARALPTGRFGSRHAPAHACLLLSATLGAAAAPTPAADGPMLDRVEPRAFGYQVGDVVPRRLTVKVPAGLVLDEASLPQVGNRGKALEVRSAAWRRTVEGGGSRYEIDLAYQIFLSPREVRTLELPTFRLRFDAVPGAKSASGAEVRSREMRVEAWPVTVAPLVPLEVSPRRGLGDIQPDIAPLAIDTAALSRRLVAWSAAALLVAAYLARVHLAGRWGGRRQRPFMAAWGVLRALPSQPSAEQRREALRRLHEALNRTAGSVVFEHDIDAFVARRPGFARLRGDLRQFFGQSEREFFAVADTVESAEADARWLRDFSRRCRDVERGAA